MPQSANHPIHQSPGPRVLHIVYNLIRGGTEGQCARVAMEMRRRGHDHRMAVFRREGFFLDQVESVCGPVFEIGIEHMLSSDTLRRLQHLQRFVRLERFDLVHAWDADAAIFGSIVARRAGIPFITSRRDLGEIYPSYKLWLMNRADRRAVAVVVNAEAIRQGVMARGLPEDRVVRIPNLFDLKEFDELADRPFSKSEVLPQGRLLACVARLDPEKDIETLIRAGHQLFDEFADLHLVIAGDGPERARLEALNGALTTKNEEPRTQNRVTFLGDVTDVPALLTHIEIGVLTPRANEGLSNTILEYMAAGKPVVATDCGGNRDLVINGETGCLVPAGDPKAVADALKWLLSDGERAATMGSRGRACVLQNHMPAQVMKAFEGLHEHVRRHPCLQ